MKTRPLLLSAAALCAAAALVVPAALRAAGDARVPAFLTPRPEDAPDGDYGPYLTYPEMQARIAGWATSHPDLVRVTSLGKTAEGRDIPLVRLSAAPDRAKAPEALILSGIHPREQQPQMAVARFVDELLSGYDEDAATTKLLRGRVVWIVPVFNVDGKIYDMKHGNGTTRGADWRKNRRANADGKTFGVDLNRNWGIRWGGNRAVDAGWGTHTADPEGDIYEGAAPLSEPENRALAAFIASRKGRLRTFLDLHSPLHAIYTPTYLPRAEYDRYQTLLTALRARQQRPYPTTSVTPDAQPKPGTRGGDSGITYPWVFYTQGVYAVNLEFAPPKAAARGVRARYAPPAEIDAEYEQNVRGPLLALIEAAGSLPTTRPGKAKVAPGPGTTDAPPVPGATLAWTPPPLSGPWTHAVLVSGSPHTAVTSEYRNAPLTHGFTLTLSPDTPVGTKVPLTLYVWNAPDHALTTARFTLTVAGPSR